MTFEEFKAVFNWVNNMSEETSMKSINPTIRICELIDSKRNIVEEEKKENERE